MEAVKIKLPIERYLEVEREGEVRMEYHRGDLYAMAGGTIDHSTLCNNIGYLLNRGLADKDSGCRAFNSEIKVEIEKAERYVYPDAVVVCGELEESKTIRGAIRNPKLVVEVLSESSDGYDRGAKMRYYLSLPSVTEYLLIEQDRPGITLFRRTGKGNLMKFDYAEGLQSRIELETIGGGIGLKEIYRNVAFGEVGD